MSADVHRIATQDFTKSAVHGQTEHGMLLRTSHITVHEKCTVA